MTLAALITAFCISGLLPISGSPAQLPRLMERRRIIPAKHKLIMTMTADELRESFPSVVGDLVISPSQDELAGLLKKTGERVKAFFGALSNTSSKEYVLLQKMAYNGGIENSTSMNYYYLIVHHPSEDKPLIQEYRTDKKNRPVAPDAINGFFMTSGYACLSLHFHPSRRQDVSFRYLGKQKSGLRARIIAFAERLDTGNYLVNYTDAKTGKSTRLPVQGFAWIDPNTFQILRLRTYLQNSGDDVHLAEQITDVTFSEVNLSATRKLWLPHEVLVTTVYGGRTYRNLHRYSDYKFFAVNSDFKIDQPKIKGK